MLPDMCVQVLRPLPWAPLAALAWVRPKHPVLLLSLLSLLS
jgi:hypothetical protein